MPNKQLTLTIVIPAYNEERYLRDCLQSIKTQIEKADEVIVVDNNSTDKTAAIAKSFAFVKLIKEPKQGVVYARTTGFNKAVGDIIARIDADTRLPKNWVSQVKSHFGDESVAAITGPAGGYDLPGPSINWLPHHALCLILSNFPSNHPFLFGFNMALRRQAWRKVRSRLHTQAGLHEDLDLAIHLDEIGLKTSYTHQLLVQASGRRYNDHLADFYSYIWAYRQTYKLHGMQSWKDYLATAFYTAGYFMYWPWTRMRPTRLSPLKPD